MVNTNDINKFIGPKMNWDVHPSLLDDGSLIYLLNGDITGHEGTNNDYFVQNLLGNESCYSIPEGFTFKGSIKLNNSEHAVFLSGDDYDEIGILYVEECSYQSVVSGTCFNFRDVDRVRGVYKFNNAENDRRIYFIDGTNSDKYLDIDKPFPQSYTGSLCSTCNISYTGLLDCNALRINKLFVPPCGTINQNVYGQLLSGVYQVGIAYAIDDLVLTDYYFSPVVKAFSESSNIGLDVDITCLDNPFDQISVILISNTRENSLVVYNLGFFPISTESLNIANVDNTTILSTQQAVQKKPVFETSQHIVSNGEILMLGKHNSIEPLNYQPQANNITIEWVEIKVPKKDARKYPSFMRDEVCAIGLEWFGRKGNSRGGFHIPGLNPSEDDLEEFTGDNFSTNDIYELDECVPATLKGWQFKNTATQIYDGMLDDCENCSGEIISKIGRCGYWESADYVYPNDSDVWGSLACQPIRHHRMPSHDITHIHGDFTTEVTTSDPEDCYTVSITDQDGSEIYSYEYCPSGTAEVIENDCINILTIRVNNIEHPKLEDGSYDPDISGYRILVGDRINTGNKSILHKGLIFNTMTDTSTEDVTIFYPNYPFNDLFPDPFLSTTEVPNNPDGTNPITDWRPPNSVQRQHFTYHSPDIHFREIKQEFGTELKIYGEEIGWIDGKFTNVYKHPQTRLGVGSIETDPYTNHAAQLNSVCNYSSFDPWFDNLFSRFEIVSSQYLLPINQILSNGKKFNNNLRETSYYLEIGRTLQDPTNIDTSRVLATEFGYFGNQALPSFTYFDEVSRTKDGIIDLYNIQGVSYYTGIKIKQPNQYGSLEQIKYRPVTCITLVNYDVEEEIIPYTSEVVYGGDIYITRHSLLRKMPIFTQWLEDVSIDTEIDYRDSRNLWFPRFWYDNLNEADDQYNLDGFTDLKSGSDILAYGKFYIFVTGVLNYWCESEFIADYREQDFTINGQFYPKIDYNDIARTDKIPYDNKYLYNLTLLNNEIERVYQNLDLTSSDADFTVHYSLKNDLQSQNDKWLQFLPLNYSILPRTYGRFTGMHYTDDYSIFFLFENEILYSQLNYSLNVNEGSSILLSQGDIFTNRLRKLSNEETGYTGCVDPLSFVNTRYGTFYFDRYRKKIFQWTGQLKDVTGNMQSWLNHYLEYAYPEYTDYTIISVFDNFTDKLYFTGGPLRNKWTISYKPLSAGVISFHSFTPNFYLTEANTFLSVGGNNENYGIWKHNKEYVYQSYYGEQVSFEAGFIINTKFRQIELQSVEVFAEFVKTLQYGSNIYKKDMFFDKIFAYNNNGSTGLMDVLLKNKSNPNQSLIQNSDTNSPLITEVTFVGDGIYRFNKFESIRIDHDTQASITLSDTGMEYVVDAVDPTIPPRLREDLKGKWFKLHLRLEENTDYKVLLQLVIPNEQQISI